MKYTAAIIGCGSIGANKPDHIDYPGSPNILTHANAIDRHLDVELFALIDSDKDRLSKATAKWHPEISVNSYNDLIMGHKVPDIMVVAVPTENHFEVLNEILDHPIQPKIIIAEKPFCSSYAETNLIYSLLSEKCKDGRRQVPVLIDYIRRFANGFKNIKAKIDSGEYGKALNCRVLYTRGLRHEGCHGIDLMRYFFGECKWYFIQNNLNSIIDRDENDPTVFADFEFEKCPHVIFQPCDGREYGIFEVDICFEKTRLRLIDNGLYVEQYHINDENEWGHKSLDYSLTSVIRKETGLNTALYNVIDNAMKFLDGKEDLICTIEDAIKVHEILDNS